MTDISDDLLAAVERPFRGKLFAYVTHAEHGAYALSIVVDGETGHYPLSPHVAYGRETEVREVAQKLNRDRLRLPSATVVQLLTQSMRNEPRRRSR